jgi:hypothetical protein
MRQKEEERFFETLNYPASSKPAGSNNVQQRAASALKTKLILQ